MDVRRTLRKIRLQNHGNLCHLGHILDVLATLLAQLKVFQVLFPVGQWGIYTMSSVRSLFGTCE